jgi:hypothetical protein
MYRRRNPQSCATYCVVHDLIPRLLNSAELVVSSCMVIAVDKTRGVYQVVR